MGLYSEAELADIGTRAAVEKFGEGVVLVKVPGALGSGFIISSDGYVISNNHVIKNADEIIVRLSDRREFKAELVGADERRPRPGNRRLPSHRGR